MKVLNVVRNMRNTAYSREAIRKVRNRLRPVADEAQSAVEWARTVAVELETWAGSINAALWQEALTFKMDAVRQAQPTVDAFGRRGITTGGAASIELLYFLTRLQRPTYVLETGVAAGWSSWAFLQAMQKNDHGTLLSSDLPYLTATDPERVVGSLVPESLKARWHLRIRGDRDNLPYLLDGLDHVDLMHYDSDKSRTGREFFYAATRKVRDANTIFVMDDIQDDCFFRDMAAPSRDYVVFHYGAKFVGLRGVGPALKGKQ